MATTTREQLALNLGLAVFAILEHVGNVETTTTADSAPEKSTTKAPTKAPAKAPAKAPTKAKAPAKKADDITIETVEAAITDARGAGLTAIDVNKVVKGVAGVADVEKIDEADYAAVIDALRKAIVDKESDADDEDDAADADEDRRGEMEDLVRQVMKDVSKADAQAIIKDIGKADKLANIAAKHIVEVIDECKATLAEDNDDDADDDEL